MAKEAANRVQKYIDEHPEVGICGIPADERRSFPVGDSKRISLPSNENFDDFNAISKQ